MVHSETILGECVFGFFFFSLSLSLKFSESASSLSRDFEDTLRSGDARLFSPAFIRRGAASFPEILES